MEYIGQKSLIRTPKGNVNQLGGINCREERINQAGLENHLVVGSAQVYCRSWQRPSISSFRQTEKLSSLYAKGKGDQHSVYYCK